MAITREKIDRLEEIRDEMLELVGETEQLLRGTTEEAHARAYWLSSLKIALTDDHEYLSKSANMSDAIEDLEEALAETTNTAAIAEGR